MLNHGVRMGDVELLVMEWKNPAVIADCTKAWVSFPELRKVANAEGSDFFRVREFLYEKVIDFRVFPACDADLKELVISPHLEKRHHLLELREPGTVSDIMYCPFNQNVNGPNFS